MSQSIGSIDEIVISLHDTMVDSYSTLPQVITKPEENEKQVAIQSGKEVAGVGKEISEPSVPPEAITDEGDKEYVEQDEKWASREIPWSAKSWKEKSNTRFCGVRLWLIMLVDGVLALVGIVVGSVLDGYVEGKEHPTK